MVQSINDMFIRLSQSKSRFKSAKSINTSPTLSTHLKKSVIATTSETGGSFTFSQE